MKSILVTGASGFVGRQVLKHLAKFDIDIIVVTRNEQSEYFNNIPQIKKIIHSKDLFIENEQWWQDHLHGIDTIIHIAWYVEPGKYLNSDKNIECMQGTLTLAKAAIATGVKKFVGIGTCFEYDLDQDFLSTSSPLKPLTIYAAAKAATYISLSQWLATHAVEFAWCRLFYLYGEGEDNRRFVPYLRSKLVAGEPAELTSGKQVRDFMNVDEAGKLIALTAIEDHQGPINICSGLPITIRQLAESIADEYGRRDLLKFGVRADNLIDPPRVVGIKSFNTP